MQFAWGYIPTFVLEAAVRHRVFDVLDSGPKTLKETAAATGASERGLRTIMNVLVGLNFLAKTGQRYTLTPESQAFLVSTKPGFHGGILKHTSAQLIPKWLQLNEIVGSGKPAVAESFGFAGFGYHSSEEEYVELDSIEPRLYLLTRLITDASR